MGSVICSAEEQIFELAFTICQLLLHFSLSHRPFDLKDK